MSKPIQITLKAGARIYLNGAVVQAKSKTTLELLNDVTFLLDSHVLQADETSTPLRQLYFVMQSILIDPINAAATRRLYDAVLAATRRSFVNATIVAGLDEVAELMAADRVYDAMRRLRPLFAIEDRIMAAPEPVRSAAGHGERTERAAGGRAVSPAIAPLRDSQAA